MTCMTSVGDINNGKWKLTIETFDDVFVVLLDHQFTVYLIKKGGGGG